jgi:hypothetical protein
MQHTNAMINSWKVQWKPDNYGTVDLCKIKKEIKIETKIVAMANEVGGTTTRDTIVAKLKFRGLCQSCSGGCQVGSQREASRLTTDDDGKETYWGGVPPPKKKKTTHEWNWLISTRCKISPCYSILNIEKNIDIN